MPLKESSITRVRDIPISQIISQFTKINSTGLGLCPFHDEKTPSFRATDSKGIYKCFGCGKSGDVIDFVMNFEKIDFVAAIEKIASLAGVELEHEETIDREQYEKQKAETDILKFVLRWTADKYFDQLWNARPGDPVVKYLSDRGITREIISSWHLGWAGEGWNDLSGELINAGYFAPAEKLGIIRRKKSGDGTYNAYRSRIIIPIENAIGEMVGIGGRWFNVSDDDFIKYINPPDNAIYQKSQILFGLSRAAKPIHEKKFAFIVEGFFDVITMHENGFRNTVGTCGTALTDGQTLQIKKHTNRVVVLRDGDDAGIKAAKRDIPIFLKNGFKTEIAILPAGADPDSFIRGLDDTQKNAIRDLLKIDDGFFWIVSDMMAGCAGDDFQTGITKGLVIDLLATIPDEMIRGNYFESLVKKYKWPKADLQKRLTTTIESNTESEAEETNIDKMPKWMDRDEFLTNGYCTVKTRHVTGYYTMGASGKVEITNFIITPLFHVFAGKDSRHLVQIDNGTIKAVLDIESAALVSIDLLQKYLVCHGAFVIYGAKLQMLRIATTLLKNFPRCLEVSFLGWQADGFFAYVDRVFIPGLGVMSLDDWGIIKHHEKNFLIPAASAAYKELQGRGDDPYESDRVLSFHQSPITFSDWAALMKKVYVEKGTTAIAFSFLTIFRDIIFSIDNNAPHLYAFGERSAGKSKWAESITALFYRGRAAFNLNSGTDFAFFSYMQRFCNCPAALNEFDEKIIKPEWFQSIKGVFDGEGRQRGVLGSKNRTEIMKIKSTLILTGQFLCTMDDNSIVSRSIIEGFNERELTQSDKDEYNKLKRYEETGISSLVCEVMKYRDEFRARYRDRFNEILSAWRKDLSIDGGNFNQRIAQNWCALYTCYDVMSKYISLPDPAKVFENYCKEKALYWSGFIRSSDTLSEFWNTFSFLVDTNIVVDGWDFKIKSEMEIKIRRDRKDEFTQRFTEPVKVLYLRMNNVHKHYQHAYRMRTGKEGMSMENLLHYFSSRKYFLGPNKSSSFKRWINRIEPQTKIIGLTTVTDAQYAKINEEQKSSSIMFIYDQLGIDIERSAPDPDDTAAVNGMSAHATDLPFPVDVRNQ